MRRPHPRHPAGTKHARLYQRWSCVICQQEGLGGLHGWTAHYSTHHYTPGETA